MDLQIFSAEECPQGSDTWLRARAGKPTASRFSTVCASAKDGKERLTRSKYMRQLAGEIITKEPAETFKNEAMDRGRDQEPLIRAQYAFDTDAEIEAVGFLYDAAVGAGASPDGLIGKNGMVEFKSHLPDILIEIHLKKEYPPAHEKQLQGNLWIAKREWIDIVCGWPKMPLFKQRVYRNEPVIKYISLEVADFNEELARMVKMIERLS